jgi:hypothetical protein
MSVFNLSIKFITTNSLNHRTMTLLFGYQIPLNVLYFLHWKSVADDTHHSELTHEQFMHFALEKRESCFRIYFSVSRSLFLCC